MAVTEESRYRLFKQLEVTLGAEHANTLMGHLPPVGWADVATKADIEILRNHVDTEIDGLRRDLVQLEVRMGLRFESIEHAVDAALSGGLHRQFVQIIASVAAMLTVMLTLAVTVNQLLGG